jgi:hypothetical protein
MSFKIAPYAKSVEAALGAALVVAADFVNQFADLVPPRYLAIVNSVIVVGTAVRVFATQNTPVVDVAVAAVEAALSPAQTPAMAAPVPVAAPIVMPAFSPAPAPSLGPVSTFTPAGLPPAPVPVA